MVFGFMSQITTSQDREQAALARVQLVVSTQQAKLSELDKVIEAEWQAKQQVEELSVAQRLQIETEEVESFKRSFKYWGDLVEYEANTFVTCFIEVSWAFAEKGVQTAIIILTELRGALIPLELIPLEAPRVGFSVAQVLEAEVQALAEERVLIDDPI